MSTVEATALRLRQRWGMARGGGTTSAPAPRSLEYSLLLTATLCLLAGGLVMVYSASSPSMLAGGSSTSGLERFLIYGTVGLLVMRKLARTGLDVVRRYSGHVLGIAFITLLAVRLPGLGHAANGSQRWLGVGPLQFEPSELMKMALVLYAAHMLSSGRPGVRQRQAVKRLLMVCAAACALVFSQRDLGTTLVIALTVVAMLWSAAVPLRTLALMAVVGVVAIGVYAALEPYAAARITSFLNPWHYASGSGFQAVEGQIALGHGGLLGTGPGAGVVKDLYLPEASTDFILAVIGEELGVIGVFVTLCLFGMIAVAGVRVARGAKARYPALLAVGVTAVILVQSLLNIFAVLGLAPVTGVPLPFISYGASNLLVMLAGIGLLLNVASGGSGHLRAVQGTPSPKPRRSRNERADTDRNRDGWDRGSRRPGDRGRRRAQ